MKGNARPTWTQGRHAWLSKLKAQGARRPRGTGEGSVATYCLALGWTTIQQPYGHDLTTEGVATLARWDAGETGVPKREQVRVNLETTAPPALASMLVAIGTDHAAAVRRALADYLDAAPARPSGEVAAILREGVAAGEIGADAGIEIGGTRHGRAVQRTVAAGESLERGDLVAEIDGQGVRAPQLGVRRPMAASLGLRTTPSGFANCLACGGRGTVGHNFLCQPCHGSGKIRREVEP